MKPERLSRSVIYESQWVNLYVDAVRFPNGRVIERHHLLDFKRSSVAAVVADNHDRLLFVEVCRYTTGETAWELPAGGVEAGESPIEAARREVLEESGFETNGHELVYTFYPLNGIANKVAHIVRCVAGRDTGAFDGDETSGVRWLTRQEVATRLAEKSVTDGLSLAALLVCGWG